VKPVFHDGARDGQDIDPSFPWRRAPSVEYPREPIDLFDWLARSTPFFDFDFWVVP
jgi:hypothetical protein